MLRRALLATLLASAITPVLSAKERILLHRIGPSQSTLFIANADGSGERPLMQNSGFDYNASFSADGKWIIFTSERAGSADIYRVHPDGSGLERLTDHPAYDDQAVLSPDGKQLAFVSSRGTGSAEIWVLDLADQQGAKPYACPGQFPAVLVTRREMDRVVLGPQSKRARRRKLDIAKADLEPLLVVLRRAGCPPRGGIRRA